MPQRLFKPGIRQSRRWNRVSWFAQSLYSRIITMVDDYGRYEGDPLLIRNEAFPLGDPDGNDIPLPEVVSALLSLVGKEMLSFYAFEGGLFLQVSKWKERVRAESKFPDPKKSEMLTIDGTALALRGQMTASPPQPQPQPTPLSGKPDVEALEETQKTNKARIVLHYLNEKAGRHFTEVDTNLKNILARLKEVNDDVEGVKQMIDRQCSRWKGDAKMDEYLRPATLFAKSNFQSYYDNRTLPVNPSAKPQAKDITFLDSV
jgi:uncharacterized phage protein (TIGR02220 family)